VRRLIVNADDFGLTRGVNRAIVEAHAQGIVTSTTLMANSAAFDEAVKLAQSRPNLAVGCHLMFVDGEPLLPPNEVNSLISARDGKHFYRDISGFAVKALTGRLKEDQIEAEATAQIRKLQSGGIQVSHVDSHKHTHLFPAVLRPVLRAARTCGVKAIRNPFGRVALRLIAHRPSLWKRYSQLRLLNTLAGKFEGIVTQAGLVTTNGSLGVAATGALDEALFRLIIENLSEGTWEFVTHPGYNDAELSGVRTRLRESRETELKLLTSPGTRELLDSAGAELISFRDLACTRS
jgi:hopanoid biosynthesis associated protein HpnK